MASQTVLLIDDEIDLIEEIGDWLNTKGFETLLATSGKEGLALIERHHPGVIICDISMPEMDGYQVLDRVRAMPDPFPTTPFLFLTAHGTLEDEVKGRGFGADDYLPKPVDMERLAAIIRSRVQQTSRFEVSANSRVKEAQQRVAAAARIRLETMEQAFVSLRPLLREASGANNQLISLMEGIVDPEWMTLGQAVKDRLKTAQEIVRKAGILAAIPPSSEHPKASKVDLALAVAEAETAAGHRMQRGGTIMTHENGEVIADFYSLRCIIAGLLVWASEKIPAAAVHAGLAGDGVRFTISSAHRSSAEMLNAWLQSLEANADPADAAAVLVSDAMEAQGGKMDASASESDMTIEFHFFQS